MTWRSTWIGRVIAESADKRLRPHARRRHDDGSAKCRAPSFDAGNLSPPDETLSTFVLRWILGAALTRALHQRLRRTIGIGIAVGLFP